MSIKLCTIITWLLNKLWLSILSLFEAEICWQCVKVKRNKNGCKSRIFDTAPSLFPKEKLRRVYFAVCQNQILVILNSSKKRTSVWDLTFYREVGRSSDQEHQAEPPAPPTFTIASTVCSSEFDLQSQISILLLSDLQKARPRRPEHGA